MKKILLLLLIGGVLFAKTQEDNEYMVYVNKLINYEFTLKNFGKIKAPFEEIFIQKKIKKPRIVKSIKITLLSIFNNKAYVQMDEFLGEKLVKSVKKWIGVGDKIGNCRVSSITLTSLYLICKDKKIVKTLNQKIPGIKEIK